MPVIDFHTHVFPEAIAEKTISMLAQKSNSQPFGNGTFSSLLSNMQTSGVTHSVTLPVVTRPKQFDSILKYAVACSEHPQILPLAAFIQTTQHRKNTCCKSNRLDFTASSCIGLSADHIDDPKYILFARICVTLPLPVVIHAGIDDGFPETVHCTPDRTLHMLEQVYGDTVPEQPNIVLAHGGANRMHEEVLERLCGKPVYFDISFILSYIQPELLLQIIRKHKADRILFATDFPWSDPAADLTAVQNLPLTDAEKEQILWKNAQTLLHLPQI
ncbi:MAG: amidohydrolase family protein [Ruminococcus sp.]